VVPISALDGTGMDKLLETLLFRVEMMDLRETPEGRA
jgi:translation initiation factor IF-2